MKLSTSNLSSSPKWKIAMASVILENDSFLQGIANIKSFAKYIPDGLLDFVIGTKTSDIHSDPFNYDEDHELPPDVVSSFMAKIAERYNIEACLISHDGVCYCASNHVLDMIETRTKLNEVSRVEVDELIRTGKVIYSDKRFRIVQVENLVFPCENRHVKGKGWSKRRYEVKTVLPKEWSTTQKLIQKCKSDLY